MADATLDALDLLGSLAVGSTGASTSSAPTAAAIPMPLTTANTPVRRAEKKPRIARVPWTETDDTLLSKLVEEL
jgi:hypothetical protein